MSDCDSMDCSLPGCSIHGILQPRIQVWVANFLFLRSLPTQGLNPHLLHLLNWQAGSLPPAPPGKPSWCDLFKVMIWLIVIIFSMKKSLLLLRTDHLFYLLLFSHCVWLFETPWLQLIGLPCASPTPGVCSDSCPLSQRCHLTISSLVIHFSSCPRSFQNHGIFQRFDSLHQGGQSIGVSASASVFPMNIQGGFPLENQRTLVWCACCPRDSQESTPAPQLEASILWCWAFSMVQLSHLYMTTGKTMALTILTFVGKVISVFKHGVYFYLRCIKILFILF